jgi:hypothetical protein
VLVYETVQRGMIRLLMSDLLENLLKETVLAWEFAWWD